MPVAVVTIQRGTYTVYAIKEQNGECKLLDFLESLDKAESAKITRYLERLRDAGRIENSEICKAIGNKFFELRTRNGARVFFFYDEGKIIICTNGYVKKKDKLDPGELVRADTLRTKYFSAKNDGKLTVEE